MCTAIFYRSSNSYFGRNLDLDRGYGERVVITPRNFPFRMRLTNPMTSHYAMIGMAAIVDNCPLYFEATNEKGLSIAGLNFPCWAVYREPTRDKQNIAPFEFIPWMAGKCASVDEAEKLLSSTALVKENFSESLPLSPLHWIIGDKKRSITVESTLNGLYVYQNPFDVLTNSPPFDFHVLNMSSYTGLTAGPAQNMFGKEFPHDNYSLGMSAIGMPGDFSSASRFVRAFFVKENSVSDGNEESDVNQFFHIMSSVAMPKGCVKTGNGFEYTRYSSCCNAERGIYYCTTYSNFAITSVDMHSTDLDGKELVTHEITGLD